MHTTRGRDICWREPLRDNHCVHWQRMCLFRMWSGFLRRPCQSLTQIRKVSHDLQRPSALRKSPSPLRDSSFCFWSHCCVILWHISSYFSALPSFLSFLPFGFNSLHFSSLLCSILSTHFFPFLSFLFLFSSPIPFSHFFYLILFFLSFLVLSLVSSVVSCLHCS